MTLGSCCNTGAIHEGTPKGTFKTISGCKTYIAVPEGDYDKTKVLLYLPDAFGHELINNRLLADSFAANGFLTYVPDLFNGDPFLVERMNDPTFKPMEWFASHSPFEPANRKPLWDVIEALKQEGVTHFAATGYCYGARYVVDLLVEGTATVGAVAHPSILKLPDDLEALKKTARPILFNTCEEDTQFPITAQASADEILGGEKFYKRNYYAGNKHGFAVRPDMSDPIQKAAKEAAFEETITWFKAHF